MEHKLIPRSEKTQAPKSNIKVMLVAFFDDEGIEHREFVPMGTSVTAAFYLDVLTRFRESVRRKQPQKWKNNWALHHDNAPSRTAMALQQFLAKNNIAIVPHTPYSSDLAPSDFWLFPTLKIGFLGRRWKTSWFSHDKDL
jgi:hypothetical protein